MKMSLQQQSDLAIIQKQVQLPQRVWDAICRDFGKPERQQRKENNKVAKNYMRMYLAHRGITRNTTPEMVRKRVSEGYEY